MIRCALIMALALGAGGCAPGSEGPELLVIPSSSYARAFDAADAVVREESMSPALRDRRGGVIETEPRIEGSVLEPWRDDNATAEQAWENTFAFQRRRWNLRWRLRLSSSNHIADFLTARVETVQKLLVVRAVSAQLIEDLIHDLLHLS